MNTTAPIIETNVAEELARIASRLQEERTGHPPSAANVVLGGDTLVVTLHEALTPAESALSQSPAGAAQVQEFHRQLFSDSNGEMLQEIQRLTGRQVRESNAEIETAAGTTIHAFTTGAMVQVYLLTPSAAVGGNSESINRAEDDGMRVTPAVENPNDSEATGQHAGR